MKPRIENLSIERLRAIRSLNLTGLGRVTLFTGRNNTAKSTILEALRLLSSAASPTVVYEILHSREEDTGDREGAARPLKAEGFSDLSALFNGFPQHPTESSPIVIEAAGGSGLLKAKISVGWFSEEEDSEGGRRLLPRQEPLFPEEATVPVLVVETADKRRLYPPRYYRPYGIRGRYPPSEQLLEQLPCVYVSPYGGERTAALGSLWDKIALSDHEKDLVDALRIIDSKISAVSMVGGEGPRQTRTAIVRSDGLPRPVPLRSFGDGLNRLFGIVLSLVNAKDGLLLIDEFENGMHHTIQTHVWRAIFSLASRLNIQVFATSHSWDAIEAFQKAASETPEEGVLIRLTRKGDDIIPTLFREDELAVVTRDRIEVR